MQNPSALEGFCCFQSASIEEAREAGEELSSEGTQMRS
jgi:hypothetical protein